MSIILVNIAEATITVINKGYICPNVFAMFNMHSGTNKHNIKHKSITNKHNQIYIIYHRSSFFMNPMSHSI